MKLSVDRQGLIAFVDSVLFLCVRSQWYSESFWLKRSCDVSVGDNSTYDTAAQRELKHSLLCHYSTSTRPVLNDSDPITVFIDIDLIRISDFDEVGQILRSSHWVRLYWYDGLLKWDPSEHANITRIWLHSGNLWKPDITIYNDVSEFELPLDRFPVIVQPDGLVQWSYTRTFQTDCAMNVLYFPFDVQECNIKFGSWVHNGNMIDIQTNQHSMPLLDYEANGAWEMVSTLAKRTVLVYPMEGWGTEIPYPDVTYYMTLKRRMYRHLVNIIIPTLAITAVSFLVFFLPVESGEKMSLILMIMLSLVVFLEAIIDALPPVAVSLPILDVYLMSLMVLMSLMAIVSIATIRAHQDALRGHRVPRCLRFVAFNIVARVLCERANVPYWEWNKRTAEKNLKYSSSKLYYNDFSKVSVVSQPTGFYAELLSIVRELHHFLEVQETRSFRLGEAKAIKKEWIFFGEMINRAGFLVLVAITVVMTTWVYYTVSITGPYDQRHARE